MNELAVKTAEKNKIKAEYEQTKIQLENLNKNNSTEKLNNLFVLSWLPATLSAAATIYTKFNLFTIMLFLLFLIIAIVLTLKNKKSSSEKLKHAKQIGFYESRLESLKEQYKAIDVSQMDFYKQKLQTYNKNLTDLRVAKDVLGKAFEQLQMDYSPKLNSIACGIFKSITDGEYVDFMVDEDYNVTVRNSENILVSSDYLSSGTFDQIYFSLRMALVSLIGGSMPVVLDDAFALYDDTRLKKAMEYLNTLKNQVLIFSCQTREEKWERGCE